MFLDAQSSAKYLKGCDVCALEGDFNFHNVFSFKYTFFSHAFICPYNFALGTLYKRVNTPTAGNVQTPNDKEVTKVDTKVDMPGL